MTLVVPYVEGRLEPETVTAIAAFPVQPEFRRMTDDYSYGRLLTELWALNEGFVVCEHDMLPTPDALDTLLACPRDWCGFPYPQLDNTVNDESLGFTKFSDALVRSTTLDLTTTHWHECDGYLREVVLCAAQWHRHLPLMPHLHEYSEMTEGRQCTWPHPWLKQWTV